MSTPDDDLEPYLDAAALPAEEPYEDETGDGSGGRGSRTGRGSTGASGFGSDVDDWDDLTEGGTHPAGAAPHIPREEAVDGEVETLGFLMQDGTDADDPEEAGTEEPVDEEGAYQLAVAQVSARSPHTMVPGLERIESLLDLLGQPQKAYPSVHLTGTNGKTSTTRMIDSLLRSFGLRTGRYTSPHLQDVRERIALDGEPCTEGVFAAAWADVAPYVEMVDRAARARGADPVTYFELLTAMAFSAFADAPVDVAIVEVGLGGLWDATNVMGSQVAVVTPISLDHQRYLGTTVEAIATEKAGIIHAGATAILSAQPPAAAQVLLKHCAEVGATVAREGIEFAVSRRQVAVGGQLLSLRGVAGTYDEVFLPLHGAHQASNAAAALAAVEAFLGAGQTTLALDAVQEGFANADSPGRLEVVRSSPTTILDGAHNPAGAAALATALKEEFAFERLVGVIAMLDDKDALGTLLALEPVLDHVVITSSNSPRALRVEVLEEIALDVFGDERVRVEPRLPDALEAAYELLEDDTELVGTRGGGVLVTGSLVTVGEARTMLRRS